MYRGAPYSHPWRHDPIRQADLAKSLEVDRKTLSAWEQNHRPIDIEHLVRIAVITGYPVEWFVAGLDAKTPTPPETRKFPRQPVRPVTGALVTAVSWR